MNNKTENIQKLEQTNEVKLCSFNSHKPFDKVVSDFEQQLGRFDEMTALSSSNIQKTVKSMEGTSGLMIISTLEMGKLLPALLSSSIQAKQYLVGNPYIANTMAQHNTLAALYAPPRVLIYTKDEKTWISYDLPSASFGKLSSSKIDQTAKDLDQKFEKLARIALA
jgi:uncharacterized protein (DUF302 family)